MSGNYNNDDDPYIPLARNPVAAAAASATREPYVDLSQTTLFDLCQDFVVTHMKHYPPQVFQCLELDDYETLIRRKHLKSTPSTGSGGLDGTGRVGPALGIEYITELEASCPHLAQSNVVDQLVWKDCVEFRFKKAGTGRPRALYLPWPLLVEQIQSVGRELALMHAHESALEEPIAAACIHTLETCPMNVSLLQATAIGKTIKIVLKRFHHAPTCGYHKLAKLLNAWKELAARNGVSHASAATSPTTSSAAAADNSYDEEADDLKLVETCKTWRQLYAALKQKEMERFDNIAKELRQRRKTLASDRPRIVKVRPTMAKREQLLERGNGPVALQNTKMQQLRKESSQVAAKTRVATTSAGKRQMTPVARPAAPRTGGSFGAAVAFASSGKKHASSNKHVISSRTSKNTHIHHLAGGKLMKVPAKAAKKAAMAKQWKGSK
ncbi:hypothetical protein MPSEU_000092900 [Mayamaea pseudoterrestris]|nr:hypothetical protein MPSEU_000092900 [Mayamaea pseudoterrestris]